MNIALLRKLREAGGGFVTLGELGDDPASVRLDLDEIEAFGFAIERHPYRGAAYLGPSPRLCPDQIEWELGTRRVGRRVAVWNRVTSTNDLAARASASAANEGLVILAEEQTAGRGSRGRAWTAPPGSSILMSVLLFPPAPLQDPAWLTAMAAVAVAGVVSEATGRDARIKWPNDVRVDGRKVAGILVERGQGTVIGIGLNVNLDGDDFPEGLRESATSLRRLLGRPLDRSEVVRDLLRRLDHGFDRSIAHGPGWLDGAYRRHSEHLGHEVDVATAAGTVGGRLGDLDLRAGLSVGPCRDRARLIPIREVLAIVNRPDSTRWTAADFDACGWPPPPGTTSREPSTPGEGRGESGLGPGG